MWKYFIRERLEDCGFTRVVQTEYEDSEFFLFVLAEVAQNADESSSLA